MKSTVSIDRLGPLRNPLGDPHGTPRSAARFSHDQRPALAQRRNAILPGYITGREERVQDTSSATSDAPSEDAKHRERLERHRLRR
jgi:hypothetical protein